jgi:hypothetical protein
LDEGGRLDAAVDTKPYSASSLRVRVGPGDERTVAEVQVYQGFAKAVAVEPPKLQFLDCWNTCAKVSSLAYMSGDVALLRLNSQVNGKARSRLASDRELVTGGRDVTAFGWGDTDPSSTLTASSVLQKTREGRYRLASPPDLPDCLSGPAGTEGSVGRNQVVCAVAVNNDAGIGAGDSGGPLSPRRRTASPRRSA